MIHGGDPVPEAGVGDSAVIVPFGAEVVVSKQNIHIGSIAGCLIHPVAVRPEWIGRASLRSKSFIKFKKRGKKQNKKGHIVSQYKTACYPISFTQGFTYSAVTEAVLLHLFIS